MRDKEYPDDESPGACDMSAIDPALRARHIANGGEVFRAVGEISELADGYAFRLTPESDALLKAAEFVPLQRLCCPFLGSRSTSSRRGHHVAPADGARRGECLHPRGGGGLLGGAIDRAGVE